MSTKLSILRNNSRYKNFSRSRRLGNLERCRGACIVASILKQNCAVATGGPLRIKVKRTLSSTSNVQNIKRRIRLARHLFIILEDTDPIL
ncbi:hypothetical protein D3C71_1601410 [compost metagenome]